MRQRVPARALAAAALLGVIALAYVFVVLALGRAPDASERDLLALSMIATAAVALAYPRARERAIEVSRHLSRSRRPPLDEPLRLFSGRLSRAIPLEELLLQTAETLRQALALRAAEIWTGSGGELERTVSDPDRGLGRLSLAAEQPVVAREGVAGEGFAKVWLPSILEGRAPALLRIAPATRAGELLGLIVAERPADAAPFTEREDQALGELARQIALALHNARLDSALQASLEALQRQADELRASRARIVAAAVAERRRIERDLHDGAQQRLVGLMVRLEQARELATEQPGGATEDPDRREELLSIRNAFLEQVAGLADFRTELQSALDELRDLAHGIYPPLLSDSGLAEALPAAATRASIPCQVESKDIGRYRPDVEAAVYFCCLEALQNAAKHAGESARASISIDEDAGRLVFVVEDDGVGFDPERAGGGIGLTSMSDRLGAIGGHLEVNSAPGRGARIHGSVPLVPPGLGSAIGPGGQAVSSER
jgi:signal transduction histidine kinase